MIYAHSDTPVSWLSQGDYWDKSLQVNLGLPQLIRWYRNIVVFFHVVAETECRHLTPSIVQHSLLTIPDVHVQWAHLVLMHSGVEQAI